MSENQQSALLAKWLESPPGTPAPPELDQEVVEAIWALQPERAPTPRVDLDNIWDAAQQPQEQEPLEEPAQVIPLAPRRWSRWVGGGTMGAIATAATILFIFRQVPMEPIESAQDIPTAPSDEVDAGIPIPEAERATVASRQEAMEAGDHEGAEDQAKTQVKGKPMADGFEAAPTAPAAEKPNERHDIADLSEPLAGGAAATLATTPKRTMDMSTGAAFGTRGSASSASEGSASSPGLSAGGAMDAGIADGLGGIGSQRARSSASSFEGAPPPPAGLPPAPAAAPPPPPEADFIAEELEVAFEEEARAETTAMDFDDAAPEVQRAASAPRSAPTKSRKSAKKSIEKQESPTTMAEEAPQAPSLRAQAAQRANAAERQTALDTSTAALFERARGYASSPTGTSPQNELLALAGNPNTASAIKIQTWFLLGEVYTAQGLTSLASEAYSKALGL
jgi:hypothetical protein